MPLTVGTDSYCTLADAASYWDARLAPDAWENADDLQREKALRMAFSRMERLPYVGEPVLPTQTAKWPRQDVLDQFGAALPWNTIPQFVKDAQAEEAAWILKVHTRNHTREELQEQGVASLTSEAQLESFTGRPQNLETLPLSPGARQILGRYLLRAPKRIRGL